MVIVPEKKKQLACVDDGLTGSVQPLVCRIAEIAQGRMDPVKDPPGTWTEAVRDNLWVGTSERSSRRTSQNVELD